MFTMRMLLSLFLFLALTSPGTAQSPPGATGEAAGTPQAHEALVGTVTREQIESTQADWKQSEDAASPDLGAARSLATVRPGAEVTVFLGTWCGDSRREVPRLWRALDAATASGGTLPFQIHYIGVDRQKKQPAAPIANYEIEFVPTLIVFRQGREVGRIVEQAPNGVERDLLALLSGKARGVLSATQAGETAPPPSR